MTSSIIIGITGATGAIYSVRLLEILKDLKIETHLIISKSAHITISHETKYTIDQLEALASYYYNNTDISARIASGSFKTCGMIIAPCTMKTIASIACGIEDKLISRAANVVLKERRKLVLMPRETPLHSGHLENMLKLSNYGAIIAPAVPAFYNLPKTIDNIVNHSVSRILDLFDFDTKLIKRWDGIPKN
jgi:flavin prenyltransferase